MEAGNKVKTDRIDSKKLARLLEGNLLKKVHLFSPEERADRQWVRNRRIFWVHRWMPHTPR
jgi:transposase